MEQLWLDTRDRELYARVSSTYKCFRFDHHETKHRKFFYSNTASDLMFVEDELLEWLGDNLPETRIEHNPYVGVAYFYFQTEADAAMFALRWL